MTQVKIEPSWHDLLAPEFEKSYFKDLTDFVRSEYQNGPIYPPASLIFNAFNSCPVSKVRVVIIGQDPYHGPGQANGLCFSVSDGIPHPPSLVNIFKEIELEYGQPAPISGNLQRWADQGVLLLNATLTVRPHQAGSHQKHGWEQFTDAVIQALATHREGIVYMLWGSYAQRKGSIIDAKRNLILKAVHPSPLSAYRGFLGCNHFRMANDYLQQQALPPIQW